MIIFTILFYIYYIQLIGRYCNLNKLCKLDLFGVVLVRRREEILLHGRYQDSCLGCVEGAKGGVAQLLPKKTGRRRQGFLLGTEYRNWRINNNNILTNGNNIMLTEK